MCNQFIQKIFPEYLACAKPWVVIRGETETAMKMKYGTLLIPGCRAEALMGMERGSSGRTGSHREEESRQKRRGKDSKGRVGGHEAEERKGIEKAAHGSTH